MATNVHPGRVTLQFTDDRKKRMRVGYTFPDPVSGHRDEIWATWIISEGTTPENLLEKCLVYNGPGDDCKRLKQGKTFLDLDTISLRLLKVDFGGPYNEKVVLKDYGREIWGEQYGYPKHWSSGVYTGELKAVYMWNGGFYFLEPGMD